MSDRESNMSCGCVGGGGGELKDGNALVSLFNCANGDWGVDLKRKEGKRVAILLCTYHGERFLVDQLESFAAQSYPHWVVWASDDGSQDGTRRILDLYKEKWQAGKLLIRSGPAEGFAANFLSLVCKANIDADYYAYSDQDDIWEFDKLERAVDWLNSIPDDIPALYCSRTRLVDSHNKEIGFSPLFKRRPCFANALMQNIGGGNTMVFNGAARSILRQVGDDIGVVTHDWWTYMVIAGCGGEVFYDSYPSLRYRQHEGNIVGMNSSWSARLIRIRMLWQGKFRRWNDENVEALRKVRGLLTPENRIIYDTFSEARGKKLISRIWGLKKSGVYRQTLLGNVGLVVAALFKKL